MSVGPETWYSGTPEPDGFKHDTSAAALIVAPGQSVTRVETGQFRWCSPQLDLLPGDDPAARLAAALPQARARDHLIRLAVTGRLALSDRAALEAAIANVAPDYGWFSADLARLDVEALPEDLDQIDRAGALRQAAETLLQETRNPALAQADRDLATAALARLYSFAQEVQA